MYLKKNKGDGNKPFKPFLKKKTNMGSTPKIHPTLGINLEDYATKKYFHMHHENYSKRTCPEFINSFTAMLLPPYPPKKKSKNYKEEDDEEEYKPPSLMNLIWDEAEIGDDDDDIMEEASVGHDYNLCSKGNTKSNYSPYASKIVDKKNATTLTSTSKQT
jgi:hypothetical protein